MSTFEFLGFHFLVLAFKTLTLYDAKAAAVVLFLLRVLFRHLYALEQLFE